MTIPWNETVLGRIFEYADRVLDCEELPWKERVRIVLELFPELKDKFRVDGS